MIPLLFLSLLPPQPKIILGFIVIEEKLHALLVAIHLGIGVLLFTSALLTTLFAYRIDRKENVTTKHSN